jgi:hypothetical protein
VFPLLDPHTSCGVGSSAVGIQKATSMAISLSNHVFPDNDIANLKAQTGQFLCREGPSGGPNDWEVSDLSFWSFFDDTPEVQCIGHLIAQYNPQATSCDRN